MLGDSKIVGALVTTIDQDRLRFCAQGGHNGGPILEYAVLEFAHALSLQKYEAFVAMEAVEPMTNSGFIVEHVVMVKEI